MSTASVSLVVGADGQIGQALLAELAAGGDRVIGTSRRDPPQSGRIHLDLAADPAGWKLPASVATAYLCAAVTSQQACRQDPSGTRRVNVQRTAELARMLIAEGALVVFPSTNLVFDGSVAFRRAEDPPCPLTEYGRQKAEVERRLLACGDRAAVVRLTKVFAQPTVLLAGWRAALEQGETIRPFSNMVLAPIPLPFVARALAQIGRLRRSGIFQISGNRDVTYAEVAYHLAGRLGVESRLVQPVQSTWTGGTLEALPAHTTLDMSRLRGDLGLEPPDVWQAIDYAVGLGSA